MNSLVNTKQQDKQGVLNRKTTNELAGLFHHVLCVLVDPSSLMPIPFAFLCYKFLGLGQTSTTARLMLCPMVSHSATFVPSLCALAGLLCSPLFCPLVVVCCCHWNVAGRDDSGDYDRRRRDDRDDKVMFVTPTKVCTFCTGLNGKEKQRVKNMTCKGVQENDKRKENTILVS